MWFLMGQFTFFFYILAQVMQKEILVMDSNNFDKLSRSLSGTSSRRQALKLMGGGLIGGAAMAVGLKGAAAAPKPSGGVADFPVEFVSDAGSFLGTFNVTQFLVQQGQVVAVGTLTGTVTNLLTGVTQSITQALTLPLLGSTTGTCEILHLELGPLDLDLLGLVIHLDKVVLDITAESGPGNLLGNLLCAVAGLLDGNGGALGRLANLLNQILGALGGA